MAADDSISKRVLGGDAYDAAAVTVRRTFAVPLGLSISVLALVGVLATFVVSVVLVRYRYVTSRRPLSRDRARRIVRTEDVLMWFLLQGRMFVLLPVILSVLGVVLPGTIGSLYANGVAVYRPSIPAVDARFVSVLGGTLALVLTTLRLGVDGRSLPAEPY